MTQFLRFVFFSTIVVSTVQAGDYWATCYGGSNQDMFWGIDSTSDGGFILTGDTKSFGSGNLDAWVVKLDSTGNVEWQKTYGGKDEDSAKSARETGDGGYIVVGYAKSFGTSDKDAWIFKIDSAGNLVWQKKIGGKYKEKFEDVQLTKDGGYIVAGWTESFGAGDRDAWIVKFRASGSIQWQRTLGGTDRDMATEVQLTKDGGYVVAARTQSGSDGNTDAWFIKLSASGGVVWERRFGGHGWEYLDSVRPTDDGGYIVAGGSDSNIIAHGASGFADLWVMKLDSSGLAVWQRAYGAEGDDRGYTIEPSEDGGYVVAGFTGSFGARNLDVWVLKLESSGSVLWQRRFGGSREEKAVSLCRAGESGYAVAGFTLSYGRGNHDGFVLRLSEAGNIDSSCGPLDPVTVAAPKPSSTLQPARSSKVASTGPAPTSTSASVRRSSAARTLLCESPLCTVDCQTAVPSAGVSGQPVAFEAQAWAAPSCGATVTFAWKFGDGGSGSGPSPSHTFAQAGNYAWQVTAGAAGASPVVRKGTIKVTTPSLSRSDLVVDVTNAIGSPISNLVKFTVLVSNRGTADAGAFKVNVYFCKTSTVDTATDKLVLSSPLSQLASGGLNTISGEGGSTSETAYCIAVVDPDKSISESDEANNTSVVLLPQ